MAEFNVARASPPAAKTCGGDSILVGRGILKFVSTHPSFVDLVQMTAEPFIQAIIDVVVTQMSFGRVCLLGDAAFVLRPRPAAATAKAAQDAIALANALVAEQCNSAEGLGGAASRVRPCPRGLRRCRREAFSPRPWQYGFPIRCGRMLRWCIAAITSPGPLTAFHGFGDCLTARVRASPTSLRRPHRYRG